MKPTNLGGSKGLTHCKTVPYGKNCVGLLTFRNKMLSLIMLKIRKLFRITNYIYQFAAAFAAYFASKSW